MWPINKEAVMGLKLGDRLQDNDPRNMNPETGERKVVKIVLLHGDYAYYQAGSRRARIHLSRIHSDGKKRNHGFTLLP